jgi:hypothetical protein
MAAVDTHGTGWATFGGILMILAGVFQSIAGLVALFNDNFYVVTDNNLLLFDITGWGWAHLVLGVLLFVAGASVLSGNMFGRVVGVVLATVSAVANLLFIPAYPLWSILVIVIDLLIIHSLVVHGAQLKTRS